MKKILVRALTHFALISVMQQAGFLEAVDLDPTFELNTEAPDADEQLRNGTADLIFGSHHTPYMHYDDGEPMVYLAQSINIMHELFATREPIKSLAEMRGQRIALPPLMGPDGRLAGGGHPRGNRQIMLENAGLAEDVEFVGYGPEKARSPVRFASVADRFADGAFLSLTERPMAESHGLSLLGVPPLPMIHFITVTTNYRKVEEHSESLAFQRLLTALSGAITFFKNDKPGTLKILESSADLLEYENDEEMLTSYELVANELNPTLLPTLAAIANAFHLAEYARPDISTRVNPLALWDLHFVRAMLEAKK